MRLIHKNNHNKTKNKIPEELFTILFIQLGIDICNGILDFGNDDVLNSVDSAIGDFDNFIENDKGRLERRQIDKNLNGLFVRVLALLDLLTTSSETSQFEI